MNRNWKISQYCENPTRHDLSRYRDISASYEAGGVCAMALCGGSSVGTLSHIGAGCIAEFSAKYFAEHFDEIYEAEFNTACEELIKYQQAMILRLDEIAMEAKSVRILVNRIIQRGELNKFSTTVQVVAVKDDQAIYFSLGNGSAVIAAPNTVMTLADSVLKNPPVFATMPDPVLLLFNCNFKTFTLSPSIYAISLATDGAEFETGLFYDHAATPFYKQLLADIAESEDDAEVALQNVTDALLSDNMNPTKDNIGISVIYRKPLEEIPKPLPEETVSEELDTAITENTEEASNAEITEPEVEAVDEDETEAVEPEVEVVDEDETEAVEPEVEVVDEDETEAVEPEIEVVDDEDESEAVEPEIEVVDDEDEIEAVEPEIEVVDDEDESEAVEPEIEVVDDEDETEAIEPEVEIVDEDETEAVEPEIEVVDEDETEAVEPEIEVVDEDETEAVEPEVETVVDEDVTEAVEPEVETVVDESETVEPEVEVVGEDVTEAVEPEAETVVDEDVTEAVEPETESTDDEDVLEIVEDIETETEVPTKKTEESEPIVHKKIFKFFNVSIKKK